MSIHLFDPFNDICPFCLDELRAGVTENGICGHQDLLEAYPHLRLNAFDRLDEKVLKDSAARFATRKGASHV